MKHKAIKFVMRGSGVRIPLAAPNTLSETVQNRPELIEKQRIFPVFPSKGVHRRPLVSAQNVGIFVGTESRYQQVEIPTMALTDTGNPRRQARRSTRQAFGRRRACNCGSRPTARSAGGSPIGSMARKRRSPSASIQRSASRKRARRGKRPSGCWPMDKTLPSPKSSPRPRRPTASANTFDAIATELLDKKRREAKAERTLGKLEWLLSLARPAIGARPIAEITAPEVLGVLRSVEARGRHETARRLRATIGEVFRYAVATGRAEADPTGALKGALTAPTVQTSRRDHRAQGVRRAAPRHRDL